MSSTGGFAEPSHDLLLIGAVSLLRSAPPT
jgi:hypothetical protein